MLDIEQIKKIAANKDNVIITSHVFLQIKIRGIRIPDILTAIGNGEIIEQYPNDFPYPSCLVFGYTSDKAPIHIVCGVGGGKLWIITAYFPDPNRWEKDLKTRKVM
ncbi:MAG: DUF4258 domain-containing protein [Ruminococcus sp.]|nr:DUF4258 domain-containing protein [Ruminococcus sp.]MCM1381048.1 DUF4258 domain-containing protein [Muribaculaceae bacterium]MCM1479737.1 DUF4258 domain-containing protein [Muribaculaceae bacterium]